MIRVRWFCSLLTVLLGVGCAATPPAAFYTLTPMTAPTVRPTPLTIGLTLSDFPAALDRPQLMLRASDNRLVIEELHRWAAPLEGQVARTLSENLARLTNSPRVTTFPWPAEFRPGRRVDIAIQRFDGRPGDQAVLQARWSLSDATGAAPLARVSDLNEPAGDTIETLVAAQSRLLERLAEEIAAALPAP
jgi:uncharacterized lipoprotein YmbA